MGDAKTCPIFPVVLHRGIMVKPHGVIADDSPFKCHEG